MEQEKLYYYKIPEYIEKEVNEKWFFLYNWIDELEVKSSIERDFLKFFDKIWFVVWIILIIVPIILFLSWALQTAFLVSFIIFSIIFIILFFAILFLSIKRSLKLRKISYITITNNYFSLNSKINKIKDWNIYWNKKIEDYAKLFEEEIFRESYLKKSKSNIFEKVIKNILWWYYKITNFLSWRDKDTTKLLVVFILFYTIYIAVIWVFYFFGIFLLFIIGNTVAFINKKFLILKGHKITKINSNFEKINNYSENLENERKILEKNLKEAEENKWEDWLLNKINDTIEVVNSNSIKSIKAAKSLKENIKNSSFSEIFEFKTYNSWIKKQIISPLEKIISLLDTNKKKIEEKIQDIKDEANKQKNENLKENLNLAETRLSIRKKEIEKHIKNIKVFLERIKGTSEKLTSRKK